LPYGHHTISEEDIAAVVEVLRNDWITRGPKVEEFERAVAGYCGAKYAVAFSSGTAALHAACAAAGLGPGDDAITTPLTFVATANAVVYCGGKPVFADILEDTLNIDPDEVEKRITPQTKAILPIDFAGHPADLDSILFLARKHKLIVIEDACHALGAEYRDRRIGGISDMTVFSFHPVKHITTGEGGMVTTNDWALARRLQVFRNHGISSEARQRQAGEQWYYEMVALGYNYWLTDLGCALGLSQLERLEANLARRRQMARQYDAAFANMPEIITPIERAEMASAWHLYPIRLDMEQLRATRAEIFTALRAENIGVNVHYIPVHYHPYYRKRFGHQRGEYPIAEAAYESLITLPLFHTMTAQDVTDVLEAVEKVMTYYRR